VNVAGGTAISAASKFPRKGVHAILQSKVADTTRRKTVNIDLIGSGLKSRHEIGDLSFGFESLKNLPSIRHQD